MHKGISPVIASILLVIIVLALSSAYLIFTGRLATEQTESGQQQSQEFTKGVSTNLKIDGVEGQDVIVRNIGSQTISNTSLLVFVEDTKLNYTLTSDIAPDAIARLRLSGLWLIGAGDRTLRIQGPSSGDTLRIRIKPAEGRVADLRFEEGSGSQAFDSSGNGNTGTLTNMDEADWVQGKFGKALDFDGSNDYVDLGSGPSLDLPAFTAELWWKGKAGVAWTGPLQVKLSGKKGFMMVGETSAVDAYRPHLTIWNGNAETNKFTTSDFLAYPFANFRHIVWSWDGTTAKFYLDGASKAVSTTPVSGYATMGAFVARGYSHAGGVIDEVRVYNQVYTPDTLYIMTTA